MSETKYLALRRMRLPNPGQTPSSLRLEPGDVFSLDGTEGLDVSTLLRCGVIRIHQELSAAPGPLEMGQPPKRPQRKGGNK